MYDHTFYKQVQISRSDISCRPHIKWAVSLVILHMVTSIFLQGLCGYIWVNILTLSPQRGLYADDTVLLAPSPKALQMLIDICVPFGIENDIVYNEEKTKCMCVKPSVMKELYVPTFHLGHLNIKAVEKELICLMMIT